MVINFHSAIHRNITSNDAHFPIENNSIVKSQISNYMSDGIGDNAKVPNAKHCNYFALITVILVICRHFHLASNLRQTLVLPGFAMWNYFAQKQLMKPKISAGMNKSLFNATITRFEKIDSSSITVLMKFVKMIEDTFFSQVYGTKHDHILRRYPSVWVNLHRNVSTLKYASKQSLVQLNSFSSCICINCSYSQCLQEHCSNTSCHHLPVSTRLKLAAWRWLIALQRTLVMKSFDF